MKRLTGVGTRGVLAGVVGASVMAFWFLVVDASQGIPFRTPAFLASAVLGLDGVDMSLGPILLFTAVHYGAWILVGLAVSALLPKIGTTPSALLGLVVGFLLFDLVFYLSVTITGVDVVEALGWPEVLIGNLLAGVALMEFLHFTGAARPLTWIDALAEHRIVREGIYAGLVGAAVVAFWFLLFDLVRAQPFFTPGALGSALFLGATDLNDIVISSWTVLGYTVVHVTAFVVTGFIAAAIAVQAEETPALVLGAVLLFVAFEAFFMGLLAMVAEFLLGALAWWTIAVGNVLAALAMGWFLWSKHPRLRAALEGDPLDRAV